MPDLPPPLGVSTAGAATVSSASPASSTRLASRSRTGTAAGVHPEHHAADIASVVAQIVDPPYAILAHSAGALAAARFMTEPAFAAVPKPVAFVWVDLDPLVPRWQVDYFHQGVASVARTFATVEEAARGFRRIYPKIPEDRLLSLVADGLRPVEGRLSDEARPGNLRAVGAWGPPRCAAADRVSDARAARKREHRHVGGRNPRPCRRIAEARDP